MSSPSNRSFYLGPGGGGGGGGGGIEIQGSTQGQSQVLPVEAWHQSQVWMPSESQQHHHQQQQSPPQRNSDIIYITEPSQDFEAIAPTDTVAISPSFQYKSIRGSGSGSNPTSLNTMSFLSQQTPTIPARKSSKNKSFRHKRPCAKKLERNTIARRRNVKPKGCDGSEIVETETEIDER